MKKRTPSKTLKKQFPAFRSDEDAARFVDTADLSKYDLSGGMLVQFEFQRKDTQINMRVPEQLLAALKERAKQRGIPYQRFIREALERAVAPSRK